ncbi:hypothetical protein SAMN05446589_9223 [Streptomyces sp. OV198]|jgi:hypothetical protein|uniref:hypothetical protein n=1 Tax=Streptomyces sp. OV198 TaxID=1882787 RepID=UPI000BCE0017|nr:hypothetical protein [Streptomyces sp. OV198]SOF02131.1 hypothetical protein SAMN05446589_9223 [Streptomyces sp. OV198]
MTGRSAARGYEFRVDSCVPEAVAEAFPELEAVVIGKQTVFYGDVIDEAHLFGLLARFRMFGLLIVEMRPFPSA